MPGASALIGPSGGIFAHGLAHDLQAFAHLRHAHQVPRVAVGFGARGHVELELLVARVGKELAHVVGHARGAQRRARILPARWRPAARDHADALRAHPPDAIVGEQRLVFVDARGKHLHEPAHPVQPARRRLQRQPADAEIAGHHPLAGDHLEDLQDLLALAEAIEHHRRRAQVHGVRPQPHQVRGDARQLRQQDANVLRALGNFQSQQLLDRQAVAQIVRERRQIIDAVGQRDGLRVGERFAAFFDAGMQITDLRARLDRPFRRPAPAPPATRRASRDAAAPCSGPSSCAGPAAV